MAAPSFYVTAVFFKHIRLSLQTHVDSVENSFREFLNSVPISSPAYQELIKDHLKALQESSNTFFARVAGAERASILGPNANQSTGKAKESTEKAKKATENTTESAENTKESTEKAKAVVSHVKSEHTPEVAIPPTAATTGVPTGTQAIAGDIVSVVAPKAATIPAPIVTPVVASIAAPTSTPVAAHLTNPVVTPVATFEIAPIVPLTPQNAINGQTTNTTANYSASKQLSRSTTAGKPVTNLSSAKSKENKVLQPASAATIAEVAASGQGFNGVNELKSPPNKKIKTKEAINTEVASSGPGPIAQAQTVNQANPQPSNDLKRKRATNAEAKSSTMTAGKAKPASTKAAASPAKPEDASASKPIKNVRNPRARKTDEEKAATAKMRAEERAVKAKIARQVREANKKAVAAATASEKKTPTKKQLEEAHAIMQAMHDAESTNSRGSGDSDLMNDEAIQRLFTRDYSINDEMEDDNDEE